MQGANITATPNINVVADQDALMKSNLMRGNAQNSASYEKINSSNADANYNNNITITNVANTKAAAEQER